MADADEVVATLFSPFATAHLAWPQDGEVLFLRARPGAADAARQECLRPGLYCSQTFKPYADALQRAGARCLAAGEWQQRRWSLVLLLLPRCRDEARTLLAQAWQQTLDGGMLMACQANNEGARSGEADLARLAGNVQSLSRRKCRVFWAVVDAARGDAGLRADWRALDTPQRIADGQGGHLLTRPGLFSQAHVDPASVLLARYLPADLAGRGADLGAGYGYLAIEVARRCPAVRVLDLYEAEARALELARQNLSMQVASSSGANAGAISGSPGLTAEFHWHDVTTGLPKTGCYDFIVSNPPFHQGRSDAPEIGQAFLVAAARGLREGGRFWLVANRHLPYEQTLQRHFRRLRQICDEQGYKVIEAVR